MLLYIWAFWDMYLNVISPKLQQCGKSSFYFTKELVKKGQLSDTILI